MFLRNAGISLHYTRHYDREYKLLSHENLKYHSYLAWLKPSGVATVNYTPVGFTAEKYITLVKQDIVNTSVSFVCSEMLLWYSSGGLAPAVYRESPGLISGQSMWDLWWTKKHWYRCVSGYFTSPDRIIPPLLHIHSCVIWGMYRGPVSVPIPQGQFHHIAIMGQCIGFLPAR
jgi:hypothetical protein